MYEGQSWSMWIEYEDEARWYEDPDPLELFKFDPILGYVPDDDDEIAEVYAAFRRKIRLRDPLKALAFAARLGPQAIHEEADVCDWDEDGFPEWCPVPYVGPLDPDDQFRVQIAVATGDIDVLWALAEDFAQGPDPSAGELVKRIARFLERRWGELERAMALSKLAIRIPPTLLRPLLEGDGTGERFPLPFGEESRPPPSERFPNIVLIAPGAPPATSGRSVRRTEVSGCRAA